MYLRHSAEAMEGDEESGGVVGPRREAEGWKGLVGVSLMSVLRLSGLGVRWGACGLRMAFAGVL